MLILASSSPVRLQILQKLGINVEAVISPNINESHRRGEMPRNLSLRLSKEKGLAVALLHPTDIVISADTVVCVGRKIIEKCESRDEVRNAMNALSGKNHRVFTSVCVTCDGKQRFRTVETRVKFKVLTSEEIEKFVATDEGISKAGGYTLMGFAESFVQKINGSASGVIGLPTYETMNLLRSVNCL